MNQLYYNTQMAIRTLIGQIESHQLALPDLQRPFVWTDKKVRNLFDSLYKGFPIGNITLWKCATSNKSHFIGIDGKEHVTPNELIIDGQQRLTSLYSVMLGKPVLNSSKKEKRIIISFNPLEEKFEVYTPILKNNPEWIPDISTLYTTESQHEFETDFLSRLSEYREKNGNPLTAAERSAIPSRLDTVRFLDHTNFQIIEILADVQEEDVSEIFFRLNSSGTILRQHDFILSLFSLYWWEGRDKIETYCSYHNKQSVDSSGVLIGTQAQDVVRTLIAYGLNRAHLKYAYKLLHGADFENKIAMDENLRNERFSILAKKLPDVLDETKWDRFWSIVTSSGYVTAKMIPSHTAVFYTFALYLISLERFGGGEAKNTSSNESLLSLWFYFASLTSLYTDESIMETQLNALSPLNTFDQYKNYLLTRIEETFTGDYFNVTLVGAGGLEASGPGNNAWLAYNAALMVLGAKVLFSKSENSLRSQFEYTHTKIKKKPLEKHHLFPRKYLKNTFGTPEGLINQMANYAFIEWPDNAAILDEAPSVYYSQDFLLKNVTDELKTRWESENALPSGWENMEYADFLTERRKLMAQKIREAYEFLRSKI